MALAVVQPRVLVIGWGFIGSAVGESLLAAGASVTALTPRATPATDAASLLGVHVILGRAEDAGTLEELLPGIDHVIYAASGLLPPDAAADPARDASGMLTGWVTALEAMRKQPPVSAMLLSSGGTVYGNPRVLPVSETEPVSPISAYGASRAACDMYGRAYADAYGLRVMVARCSNVYGPGQRPDRTQGAIAVFLHRLMHGLPLTIFGDGSARRDYVHIDDVSNAILQLILGHHDAGVVNIGSGIGHSVKDLISILEDVTGLKAQCLYQPERPHDVANVVLDITRLSSMIDFDPIPLEAGIRSVWEHALATSVAASAG